MRLTVLPASASRSVLMIGMPPAAAASKLRLTPFSSACRASSTPCVGEQRLVGGDDVLAGVERRLDRGRRRAVGAADQFDEDVVAGIARQRHRIVEPCRAGDVDAAILACDRAPKRRKSTIGRPVRTARSLPWRSIRRTRDAPTVPSPATPMRMGAFAFHERQLPHPDARQREAVIRDLETRELSPRVSGSVSAGDTSRHCARDDGWIASGRRSAGRRCATFCPPFQGSGGGCGRPGGCAARSRPARCGHSRRHARRSRCPAPPRHRPSR